MSNDASESPARSAADWPAPVVHSLSPLFEAPTIRPPEPPPSVLPRTLLNGFGYFAPVMPLRRYFRARW